MGDVITRFKLETTQFDSKLRDTAKALQGIAHQAELGGKDFNNFSQKAIETARALGTVQSGANNTKDKLRDLVGSYNDAAKAYNSLTETAKKGEFGQAMSQSLTQLQQQIRETKQELYSLGDSAKGTGGGGLFGGGKLDGMLQVFGGNVMTKIAGAGLNFASEMGDMVKQGIELAKQGEGIRIAFERLGRGDILQGLREATHGTVTDLELMKAAVKFNDFKLPLDQLGTMLAFAQQKAKDTGQDVNYLVDSIVTGLGRKSLMILDNLGLSATEIRERMKETGDMTKAVGAIIREQMSKAGDYVETAADRATQANVSLQNKMEELGRKFAPLEEASNNFWTSMKIGILDVVGGPLTNLLNKLTEAGRLMNAYGKIGGNTKVGRMTSNLASASEGNRQSVYQQQQAQFWRYINPREQQIKDIRAWQSGERNEALQKRIGAITEKYGSLDATKIQAEVDAAKKMLAEYQQAAKQILSPVKADIDTTDAGNKGLGGSGTTTTTTKHQTPQQRAQESFTKAEQNYKQALEQAAMELQAGTITRAEAKKKEVQAAEQRWKAIGDARNINDSDRLRKAQDEAAAEYKRLAAEVKTATEHQKAVDKATRDLENANQKLATARSEMAQAKQQGDLQAYNAAKDKATAAQQEITRLEKVKVDVERGTVDLPDIPKVIEQTVNTHQGKLMTAEIATEITQKINTVLGNIVKPEILDEVTQTINTKVGNVITPEIAKEVTQVVDVETGRVDLPDIPKVIEQTVNTHQGKLMTAEIATEITQKINTVLGNIVKPEILDEVTQTINTKVGNVITPEIAKEVTQVVDVETGRVDLPDIPKVIEQTVNTHQGKLMTAEIATEITQKINTVLGNIVKPEILDEVTQTINTKVGNVITPEIAKEVTQVVNVETGTVDLPDIPATTTTTVDFEASTRNIDAAISYVKKEMDTIPVGTIEFNIDQTKLVDLTTLKTLIDEQVKNGLEIDSKGTQGLFNKIQLGVDIEDNTWQELIDKINEKLKELDIKPISINFKTGGKTDKKDEKQGQKVSFSNEMSNITQSVSGIVSGIEQLGIDIPEGLKSVLGGIQAVAGILTGISALVTIIAAIQGTKAVPVVGWMLARGGVVHAAGGYQVPGNRMSGDQVPAMLNSGELVLNKFQQQVLAANLQAGGLQGLHLEASVHAEQIRLALNNNGKRTGRGELVTWKRS